MLARNALHSENNRFLSGVGVDKHSCSAKEVIVGLACPNVSNKCDAPGNAKSLVDRFLKCVEHVRQVHIFECFRAWHFERQAFAQVGVVDGLQSDTRSQEEFDENQILFIEFEAVAAGFGGLVSLVPKLEISMLADAVLNQVSRLPQRYTKDGATYDASETYVSIGPSLEISC